jgi:hypothetical protein
VIQKGHCQSHDSIRIGFGEATGLITP